VTSIWSADLAKEKAVTWSLKSTGVAPSLNPTLLFRKIAMIIPHLSWLLLLVLVLLLSDLSSLEKPVLEVLDQTY
jgi:hypothetical protein